MDAPVVHRRHPPSAFASCATRIPVHGISICFGLRFCLTPLFPSIHLCIHQSIYILFHLRLSSSAPVLPFPFGVVSYSPVFWNLAYSSLHHHRPESNPLLVAHCALSFLPGSFMHTYSGIVSAPHHCAYISHCSIIHPIQSYRFRIRALVHCPLPIAFAPVFAFAIHLAYNHDLPICAVYTTLRIYA